VVTIIRNKVRFHAAIITGLLLIVSFLEFGCRKEPEQEIQSEASVIEPAWTIRWGSLESLGQPNAPWGPAQALDVAIGQDNEVYVVGKFYGEVYLDPNVPPGFSDPAIMPETVESAHFDTFLSRFDSGGNLEWYRHWGPLEYIEGRIYNIPVRIDIDDLGNVYVQGTFKGPYDFNPGEGELILTTGEDESQYISKFTSEGDLVDVFTWPDIAFVESFEILDTETVLFAGSLGMEVIQESERAGRFIGTDKFAGRFNLHGPVEWIQTWDELAIREIRQDDAGSVYLRCWLSEEADVDPGPASDIRVPEQHEDAVIIKLDNEGSLRWANTISGHFITHAMQLDVAEDGSVYIGGFYHDLRNPNLTEYETDEERQANQIIQAFLIKYDSEGQRAWERIWGADPDAEFVELRETGCSGVCAHNDLVYVYGVFNDTVDFDPSSA
jgi:hypothetical protein